MYTVTNAKRKQRFIFPLKKNGTANTLFDSLKRKMFD